MTDPLHTRPDIGLPALLSALGGRRTVVDGALPTVVFVATHAAASLVVDAPAALRAAVVAAASAGLGATVVRIARGEPLAGALRGLVGLGVAALVAACTGQARDFFLPGIYVDAAYGVVFAGSALLGRPLVGHLHAALFRLGPDWRGSARLRRVFTVATLGWSGIFALRAVAQGALYAQGQTELLALSKLLLGWPVTGAAVVLTLAAVRRASSGRCPPPPTPAR